MPKITDPKKAGRIIDLLEQGFPVTSFVQILTMGGVGNGIHTIDVAVLIAPVLHEALVQMAREVGVEVNTGLEGDGDDSPDPLMIKTAVKAAKSLPPKVEDKLEEQEEVEEVTQGLMSRRKK
ncbi:MAG TPA: hypothetical protein V6D20_00700 [Candidatus Obscuribacterales bacterium]